MASNGLSCPDHGQWCSSSPRCLSWPALSCTEGSGLHAANEAAPPHFNLRPQLADAHIAGPAQHTQLDCTHFQLCQRSQQLRNCTTTIVQSFACRFARTSTTPSTLHPQWSELSRPRLEVTTSGHSPPLRKSGQQEPLHSARRSRYECCTRVRLDGPLARS